MKKRIKLGQKLTFLYSSLACNNLISNIFKMLEKNFLLEKSSNKRKKRSSLEEKTDLNKGQSIFESNKYHETRE